MLVQMPLITGCSLDMRNLRLIRDEIADIFVTFPHRSIQEFLGAFYFIMMFNTGESIESLLGSDCKEPIFMINPLFLHFCIWFLFSDQRYFTFRNKGQVCKHLVNYFWKINSPLHLNLPKLINSYPAIDNENDLLSVKFCCDILIDCKDSKALTVAFIEPLEWILSAINARRLFVSGPHFCLSFVTVILS